MVVIQDQPARVWTLVPTLKVKTLKRLVVVTLTIEAVYYNRQQTNYFVCREIVSSIDQINAALQTMKAGRSSRGKTAVIVDTSHS
jgi:hypothetical protein